MMKLACAICLAFCIRAQTAFEVASVKLAPARTGAAAYTALDSDPGMVRYSNITLKMLVSVAYKFDSRLVVGGPDWFDRDPYDVVAKIPAGVSKDRVPDMLQALLAERFKLAVHRESKEQKVYLLVVAKGGPKLTPGKEGPNNYQMLPGRIMGRSMPMLSLASILAHATGYQVVDKTDIPGNYDIDFKFTPENSAEAGPSIFTAIQEQLGLKLEPGRAPVETLLIDHAERIPIEN